MLPKTERNKKLVALRDKDPEKYSFRKLADIFHVTVPTAFEIYHREKHKKDSNGELPKYVANKYQKLKR